ncbi:MAG TPA: hypothetical protein VHD62_16035 [Opitutaceae bacterium]|nr:hypothetical protein [Opitutaceae bacterium]
MRPTLPGLSGAGRNSPVIGLTSRWQLRPLGTGDAMPHRIVVQPAAETFVRSSAGVERIATPAPPRAPTAPTR